MAVLTSKDKYEDFDKKKITNSLIKETGIDKENARKIADSVKLMCDRLEDVSSAMIRDIAYIQLIKRGFLKEANCYQRVGIPVADIRDLIQSYKKDNANLFHNSETTHKFVADATMKPYALLSLPEEITDAHVKGEMHIHDLEYFGARPLNCMQHDARVFIRWGLRIDGTGEHSSSAGSPNNIETLVNHLGQAMMAAQTNMSGGQSVPLLNVFMAPFARGLEYKRVKQAMQMFIFNLNMSYCSRGGQSIFSSITLEMGVPNFLKNETAWGPGGKECGVYGDYEKETRMIQRAITEVLIEGDSMGKPHLFPNTIYSIREEFLTPEYEKDWIKVHELSAKFSTSYFANMIPHYRGATGNYMGCRTSLNSNWTGNWEEDTMRTGNLAFVTINLPRCVYNANIPTSLACVTEEIEKVVEKAKDALIIRRKHGEKVLNEYKLNPFLSQILPDGSMYYKIENSTLSFGFVGMDEALRAMGISGGITSEAGQTVAKGILELINTKAKQYQEETGYRFSVLQTPAESTAGRFADLDDEEFGSYAYVKGPKSARYYTNSSHVPVDSEKNIIERVKIEEQFHPLTLGGHICHLFIGEAFPNPASLWSLTKKIAKTNIGFWAYTGAFSFCMDCHKYMPGLQETCDQCGGTDNVEWYDRITGYVQQIGHSKQSAGGWNKSKMSELHDRKRLDI